MNCRSAESFFSSYLEDEISQEERRSLEAHLMGCRRCSLGIREVRATMSLLQHDLPLFAPSAHFDDDLFARIRSGEGIRPTVADFLRELLAPARLKPVFMGGAAVCAVVVATLLYPSASTLFQKRSAAPPAMTERTEAPPQSVAGTTPAPAPAERDPSMVATAPRTSTVPERRVEAPVVASASRRTAIRDSILDPSLPETRYMDEIINDQFYLERGRQGQDPSVVPVNETPDGGVLIEF